MSSAILVSCLHHKFVTKCEILEGQSVLSKKGEDGTKTTTVSSEFFSSSTVLLPPSLPPSFLLSPQAGAAERNLLCSSRHQ
eukprot:553675-Hanusia_phi.AAC.4